MPTEPPVVLSPEERRRRNREEVTAAIMDASRAVMREQGVAALSLREVARRIHMQAPSLYAYFPSKAALYDAFFLQAIVTFQEYRADSWAVAGDFWDFTRRLLDDYMRFAVEQPELYRLAFERPVPGFVPSEASMAESWSMLGKLEQRIATAFAAGEIGNDLTVEQVRDLLIALCHGITSQHMANEPDLPVGAGRYGGLIPTAVSTLRAAWAPSTRKESGPGL